MTISSIFIIIIVLVVIMLFVTFEVLVSMGNAGISPSKFISDIIKKTGNNELKSKKEIEENEPAKNKVEDNNRIESIIPAYLPKDVKRWRLTAGILFGLIMVCLLVFHRPRAFSALYALASYAFWPLVIATVITFIILHQKEKKHNK